MGLEFFWDLVPHKSTWTKQNKKSLGTALELLEMDQEPWEAPGTGSSGIWVTPGDNLRADPGEFGNSTPKPHWEG